MSDRWAKHFKVAAGIVLGAGAIGVLALWPTPACVAVQHRILVDGAYAQVPGRALWAAQIICERNRNIPRALIPR